MKVTEDEEAKMLKREFMWILTSWRTMDFLGWRDEQGTVYMLGGEVGGLTGSLLSNRRESGKYSFSWVSENPSSLSEVLQEDGGVMVWFSLSTLIGIPEGKLESSGRKESMGKPR